MHFLSSSITNELISAHVVCAAMCPVLAGAWFTAVRANGSGVPVYVSGRGRHNSSISSQERHEGESLSSQNSQRRTFYWARWYFTNIKLNCFSNVWAGGFTCSTFRAVTGGLDKCYTSNIFYNILYGCKLKLGVSHETVFPYSVRFCVTNANTATLH